MAKFGQLLETSKPVLLIFYRSKEVDASVQHYLNTAFDDKIETLNTKIYKLFELHEKGQIETERFKEYYNEPNEQLKQLKRKIPELEGEMFALKDQFKSSGYIIEEAKSLYENWDTLDKE